MGSPRRATKSIFKGASSAVSKTFTHRPSFVPLYFFFSNTNLVAAALLSNFHTTAMAYTRLTDINNCASDRDWGGLSEVRKSIQSQTSIFVAPSSASQSQPQPQSQPHSQPQPRAGPLPKPGYYSAARPQTPPNYAMPSYNPAGYAPPNGLRSHNQPSLPYPGGPNGAAARLRPSAPLQQSGIYFKPSPFYELQYQVGDIKTLEGAFGVTFASSALLIDLLAN